MFFIPNSEDSSNGLSCVVIVLALVCLWQVQISGGHHHDLENMAYSKKVTLSSEFKDPGYSGSEAFNGLYSDLAHTGHERFLWLRIDLGGHYVIHEKLRCSPGPIAVVCTL